MRPHLIQCHQQKIWLSPERCMFWENQQTLILSDMHIGKTAHFRKAGIAVPQQVFQEDLHRLFQQIHFFSPQRIIVTGDLFHSEANLEHDWFSNWRKELAGIEFILVKGNHEILRNDVYQNLGIELVDKELEIGPFFFSHDLIEEKRDGFSFVGHTHPGVRIQGKGKQSFVFPCFYFTSDFCILPAFSKFTGKHVVDLQKGETAYAIVGAGIDQSIIEVIG
jgi:DNA ligase-associated metallophosphoesterase